MLWIHDNGKNLAPNNFNPLSPKIDFYVDLLMCVLLGQVTKNSCDFLKYFKKLIIYDNISPCPFKRTLGLRGFVFFSRTHYTAIVILIIV